MTREDIIGRIEQELTLFIGPLAPVVMRDKAAEFGKSIDDFPEDKLAELVEEVSFEIQNNQSKVEFQRAGLEILQETSHQPLALEESGAGVTSGLPGGGARRTGRLKKVEREKQR
ncbi:hypothetical protein HQ563_13585 [bacterium]|nr:hypothetical protein [bacterium]